MSAKFNSENPRKLKFFHCKSQPSIFKDFGNYQFQEVYIVLPAFFCFLTLLVQNFEFLALF